MRCRADNQNLLLISARRGARWTMTAILQLSIESCEYKNTAESVCDPVSLLLNKTPIFAEVIIRFCMTSCVQKQRRRLLRRRPLNHKGDSKAIWSTSSSLSSAVLIYKPAAPPYGWTSKNCVICVCFHCHGILRITRQIHCKAVEQRATLIHRQYNRDWGTSYSRPPIDPYLTSPLLQNPGGATVTNRLIRRRTSV